MEENFYAVAELEREPCKYRISNKHSRHTNSAAVSILSSSANDEEAKSDAGFVNELEGISVNLSSLQRGRFA